MPGLCKVQLSEPYDQGLDHDEPLQMSPSIVALCIVGSIIITRCHITGSHLNLR